MHVITVLQMQIAPMLKSHLELPNEMIYLLLVANDTGIPHISIYHCQKEFSDIYFLQEQLIEHWGLKESYMKNQAIKEQLQFLHVFSRCDTTSSIYGKGKLKFDCHLRSI